jgi:hypothetical protein
MDKVMFMQNGRRQLFIHNLKICKTEFEQVVKLKPVDQRRPRPVSQCAHDP